MSEAARDLAVHLAKQVQNNRDLAYLIGPGSRTWELMVEAIASITGEGVSNADIRCRSIMASRLAGKPNYIRAGLLGEELASWISFQYEDQNMSHMDFRIEAKRQADAVLAKLDRQP